MWECRRVLDNSTTVEATQSPAHHKEITWEEKGFQTVPQCSKLLRQEPTLKTLRFSDYNV
jgi:hypothetical protein